jgi:nucleotide-binding universal stress UspA family protein
VIVIKRVLHPTDFSACSRKAFEYACALAAKFNAELHLLSVLEDLGIVMGVPSIGPQPPEELLQTIREATEASLAELDCAGSAFAGKVIRTIRSGAPFREIGYYARVSEIDLIVIGTHGRSGLSHLFLGSVAEKVVRTAPCPVLTVQPEGHQFVMPDAAVPRH